MPQPYPVLFRRSTDSLERTVDQLITRGQWFAQQRSTAPWATFSALEVAHGRCAALR
jgi:hypothetical protein